MQSGGPIFVVGHPRSGTTLVATLLGRHPDISMPPETQFFPEIFAQGGADGAELGRRALDNPRVRDLELDEGRFMSEFQATSMTFKDLFELIIRSYCAKAGKIRPGEKSPNHLKWAETLLQWFPDAKIINVVRDGRDVANSLMDVPWTHKNIIKHSFDWVVSQRLADRMLRKASDRFRIVRYESLLMAPEAVLKDMCEFLSERYDPVMLDAGVSDAVPTWESGWKNKARLDIDPSNIGKWKRLRYRDQAVMNALMGRELERNGYEVQMPNMLVRACVWMIAWPFHPRLRPTFSKFKSIFLRHSK